MEQLKTLRDQYAEYARKANNMLDNKGGTVWTEDEQKQFDDLTNSIQRVKNQIKSIEDFRNQQADNFFNDMGNQSKKDEGKIDIRNAVALYFRHGNKVNAEQAAMIRNAMSTTTESEGGYTVPDEIASMVIDSMKAYGGMREAADVITTTTGRDFSWPTSDGTSEEGEIVAENTSASTGNITFGTVALPVYKYSSKSIALPLELVTDSAIDIVAFVVERLGTRLGRITNKHFTVGTGSGQPSGLINRASAGITGSAGTAQTVSFDDLTRLKHSVNRAYRNNAKYMMNDLTAMAVSLLKDTNGRPIWTPSVTMDAPDMLNGKPVVINDDMPVMAAGAKSIAFGDLEKYVIRDVANSMTMSRFDDSFFGLKNQVGFCGWMRTGGVLTNTSAVKLYVNGTAGSGS